MTYILNPGLFSTPPLHSDDWTLIYNEVFNQFNLFDIYNRRPLIGLPYFLLYHPFGLKISIYYIMNFFIILITGLTLFHYIRALITDKHWLALLISLLCLTYPIDFSKTWLTHIHARLVLLTCLVIVLLLHKFIRNKNYWLVLLANILFLFTLGIYEGGWGIVILSVLVLLIREKGLKKNQRYALFSTLFIGGLYVIWRVLIQPNILHVEDNYLGQLTFSFSDIAYRYAQALFITFYNWTGPIINNQPARYVIFIVFSFLLLAILLVIGIRFLKRAKLDESFKQGEQRSSLRSILSAVFVGCALWLAGYLPIILYSAPGFYGDDSRFSLFATIGASIVLVMLIALAATITAKTQQKVKKVTVLCVVPLILIGSIYQIWSQNERIKSWEIQKSFWNQFIEIAPGLENNTTIGIIITGHEDLAQFETLPFVGNWEARSALKVLYNDPSLNAFYYYADHPSSSSNRFIEPADWSRSVVITYDESTSEVKLIESSEHSLLTPYQVTGYNPTLRISKTSQDSTKYRFLVGINN